MASTTTMLRLEESRRKRGVSLEQIADSTKISTRFLRAIECEEFEKLPGGVFNTNYIRQYAAAIGVPQDKLLARYEASEAARNAEQAAPEPVRRGIGFRCINLLRSLVLVQRF